jgi:hypothetical protein
MVEAYNGQDFTRMIELTPLDTAAVLHDYGPVLLDADQAGSSSTVFEDISFSEPQGSGGTRTLAVESYRMVQSYDGEPETTTVYDGSCITTTYADSGGRPGPDTACVDDPSAGVNLGFGLASGSMGVLLFGPGPTEIVVVERAGAWYVDPALSAVETLLVDIERASPEQIDRTVEQWAAMVNGDDDAWYATLSPSYYQYCPGVQAPGPDASFEERKEAGRRCTEEEFEVGSIEGEVTTPTTLMEPEYECLQSSDDPAVVEGCLQGLGDPDALARFHASACRSSGEPAAVESCLQELVDEGEIEPSAVVEYRCEVANQPQDGGDSFAAERAIEKCMEYAATGDDGHPEEEQMGPARPLPPPTTTG